ncbi:MAG TPA: ABC transporter substrate-binding protein [Longimicrobiales bacterium]|nr:ABC transporter substrate-binding protein [Longimicrobiales bacterium]
MFKFRSTIATAVIVASASLSLAACDDSPTEPGTVEIVIGGLFGLTGSWATLGQNAKAALEMAVADLNEHFEDNAAGIVFAARVEDTQLEPSRALQQAQLLAASGVRIMIGPQASSEVAELKSFVDSNGILLVSPSSTAGALAVPNDNVFRFTPSDGPEGTAVAALMWDDGVAAVVPVWRQDAGNAGLEAATRSAFSALGGTVLQGVSYAASTTNFAATATALAAQVQSAIDEHGLESVAVYLAAFDEVVDLFKAASTIPVLSSVRWYGSDGVALSDALLSDDDAADFAIEVGYPNPLFGLEEGASDIWAPLSARIQAITGLEPDAFALAVYDAAWVAARAAIAAGGAGNINALKAAFVATAANHFGATGWTVLNAAGDRRYGNFDFWAIRAVGGVNRWTRVAQYETQTGRLIR